MKTALNAWIHHFFFGVGLGNFEFISGLFKNPGETHRIVRAHNSYLEFLSETGLVGGIFLATLLFVLFRNLRKAWHNSYIGKMVQTGILVSLISAAILAFIDFGLQIPANALATVFLIYILVTSRKKKIKQTLNIKRLMKIFQIVTLVLIVPASVNFFSGVYYDMGLHFIKQCRYPSGVRAFQNAVRLSPFDDRFLKESAFALISQNIYTNNPMDLHKARIYLKRSLHRNPNQSMVLFALASVEQALDPEYDTLDYLERALKSDPFNYRINLALAEHHIKKGNCNAFISLISALTCYQPKQHIREIADHFYNIVPSYYHYICYHKLSRCISVSSFFPFVNAVARAGNAPLAIELIKVILPKLGTIGYPELIKYISLSLRLKEADSALKMIEFGLESCNSEAKGYLLLLKGKALKQSGASREAKESFENALRLSPDLTEAALELARLAEITMPVDDAKKVVENLLPKHPDSADLHYILGSLWYKKKEYLKALHEFKTAYSIHDSNRYLESIEQCYSDLSIHDVFFESSRN